MKNVDEYNCLVFLVGEKSRVLKVAKFYLGILKYFNKINLFFIIEKVILTDPNLLRIESRNLKEALTQTFTNRNIQMMPSRGTPKTLKFLAILDWRRVKKVKIAEMVHRL